MTKLYPLFTFFLFTLLSCKTASKAYEQGNYTDAINKSIKKLQKDPNDITAKDILKRSYEYAVSRHEERIRSLSNSSSETRFEQIFREYQSLQGLYENISRYPSVSNLIRPTNYSSYIDTYRDKAAEVHFERGLAWMEEGKKMAYREAYHSFRNALRFKPQDIAIKRKVEEAYDAALVKILVLPMDAFGNNYYYGNSSYRMRNFQDGMIRSLNNGSSSNDFIRFYSEGELRGSDTEPDEILEMRLGRITIGQPYDEKSTRQVTAEVVVKETVYKKDSIVQEKARVHAKITTTKRTLVSEADLFIATRDAKGRTLWSDVIRGEHRWYTEFATYTGDERALSDSDKKLLNRRDEDAPREDEITDNLLRQIESDLGQRLRSYYGRYR